MNQRAKPSSESFSPNRLIRIPPPADEVIFLSFDQFWQCPSFAIPTDDPSSPRSIIGQLQEPGTAAHIMPEMKSSPEYTERRPLNRHEVQAESKVFRSRTVVKSSCLCQGIGNKVYKDRHVKEPQKLKGTGEVP